MESILHGNEACMVFDKPCLGQWEEHYATLLYLLSASLLSSSREFLYYQKRRQFVFGRLSRTRMRIEKIECRSSVPECKRIPSTFE